MSITKHQIPQDSAPTAASMLPASATKDQTAPHDGAPTALVMRPTSVAEDHMTLQGDDPSVATVRAALENDTAGSFKKSLNTCLIIWTVGWSRRPRRRIWISLTWMVPLAVVVHYWHAFFDLVHHLH